MKKWKIKRLTNIWIVVGILLVVSFIAAFFSTVLGNRSVDIRMHFASISEGKNPDMSSFDINEILSDEVLGMACEKLDNKVDIKTLRSHLSVADNFGASMLATVKQEIKDGTDTYMMFPAEYTLTYRVVSEDLKNDGLFAVIVASLESVFMPDVDKILTAITDSYKEYYVDSYIQKGKVLNINWSEIDNLDYFDKAEKISTQVLQVSRYLSEKYDDDADFVSKEDAVGYGEISSEVSDISNIEVENFKAYVIQNGLTKDKEKLLNQLEYVENYNYEKNERNLAEYTINKNAINIYDPNITKVVFIPSIDIDEDFYMNRTKIGIDYLTEGANRAKLEADTAYHKAMEYSSMFKKFESSPEPEAQSYDRADLMYDDIKTKLSRLCERAQELIAEEDKEITYREIVVGNNYRGFSIMTLAMKTATVFAFLAILVFMISYIIPYVRKRERVNAKSEGVKS